MQKERIDKTPEQALHSLMNLCAKSEKSSGDARRLMARWGVAGSDQPKVLQTLLDQKFIDDARYAAAFVREKLNLSGWGAFKIRAALAAKGIAREVIDQALAELDGRVMDQRLETMLLRKQHMLHTSTGYELRGKLMRYGLGLGYDYEAVAQAVAKIMGGVEDDQ